MFVLAGDFNARIGSKDYFITYIDTIPKRISIDKTTNAYCDVFIDFSKDMKLCTLNGRITPEFNNYICINTMGNSVINYIITEHRSINHCLKCLVHTVNDIVSGSEELKSLISSQCKAPDHSVVSLELKISSCTEVADNLAKRSKSIRKYSFYNPNMNFLNNAVWNSAVTEIINQLENQILLNTEFDQLYDNLIKMILNVVDNYLEFRDV